MDLFALLASTPPPKKRKIGEHGESPQLTPKKCEGAHSTDVKNDVLEEELKKLEADLIKYQGKGIKLAHAHQQMRLDDKRFDGIYDISERLGKPLYIHTGTSPNPYTRMEPPYVDPLYLEESIKKYPGAIFIMGHSGYDSFLVKLTYLDSCIELAKKYEINSI